jgi:DNA repair protein RadC
MDYTIKDLPEEERPREKLENHGASDLTSSELLSILLRTGTSGKNVRELASEILGSYSLDEMASRSMEDFKEFKGVSRVKAGQLKALGELARRMKRTEGEKVDSLQDVKDMCRDMRFMEKEVLRVLYLSSGNEVLSTEEFDGDVSNVGFEPRKIFSEAFSSNAAAMILVHNHPSGRSEFTSEDVEVTRKVSDLGDDLGVKLLDHVLAGESFVSMRSRRDVF